MKKIFQLLVLIVSTSLFAQAGHIMQGVGAVNMSMGGAATAVPVDINGTIHWNPAALSEFEGKHIGFDIGMFFSSPELSSSFGPLSGVTEDDRGASPMPAISYFWGKEGSKHKFAVSAFGISGFGVTFPENLNYPQDMMENPNPNFNPIENSNPISYPQYAGGFGHIESDYMLMQIGFSWSYAVSDNFSIGLQPTINWSSLELAPNPLSNPDFPVEMGGTGKGYPVSDKASAFGFGGQVGVFYHTDGGFNVGLSYKTPQMFGDFKFDNSYLDGSDAPGVDFRMDYPAIFSVGLGYTAEKIDLGLDYRSVSYSSTEGFEKKGWTQNGAVQGFGWENMDVISFGMQLKVVDKLPIRVGYTYSSVPINEELAFFSIPATAIIENAYQLGLGYEFNDKFELNAVYHTGSSNGATEGPMLSPIEVGANNPYGAVPGTSVSYEMSTDLIMFGFSLKL